MLCNTKTYQNISKSSQSPEFHKPTLVQSQLNISTTKTLQDFNSDQIIYLCYCSFADLNIVSNSKIHTLLVGMSKYVIVI